MAHLRIGTRGSALALWQAERLGTLLAARGVTAELVTIRTSGDEGSERPKTYAEGKGLFTKELEEALLDGRIDGAVHSLKDLGAVLPAGLELAAYPEREDPRDALVSRHAGGLDGLPRAGRVGTSSLRRVAALLARRPDLEIVPLRGNVPTRVRRVEQGELDAALLALAGLKRLGLAAAAAPLDPTEFVPAPGQGALAVEIRSGDAAARKVLSALDDPEIRVEVEAERAAMAELEGGCRVPLGAICLRAGTARTLHLRVYAPDGTRSLAAAVPVDPRNPRESGIQAARRLLAEGAADLIRIAKPPAATPSEVPGG
ncbi:MAG: hydroxymethylbilane synthase [Gemmatimonadetes bacterium]|nr:hydroxymethylbilane synthase [Gemmatimonadota bacterium]